jgi:hypothetical protein
MSKILGLWGFWEGPTVSAIVQHEFQEGGVQRCKYCGTSRAMYEAAPQNVCVEREGDIPPRRAGNATRAADDSDTIHARLIELEAERLAARNQPATE